MVERVLAAGLSYALAFSGVALPHALSPSAAYPVATHTVTFLDGLDGEIISVLVVPDGNAATAPEPIEHPGFHFVTWDRTFRRVTADLTVTALYEADEKVDTPTTPQSPATPLSPVSPASPETPDSPAAPETPITPESPASPVTPDAPVSPLTPDTPQEPVQPEGTPIPDVRGDTARGYVVDTADGTRSVHLYHETGEPAVGWQFVGARWYFGNAQGVAMVGWLGTNGQWYYLSANRDTWGQMQKGWIWDDGWYYALDSGALASGWMSIGGSWYWFNTVQGATFGRMRTGWLCDGGTWYYLEPSGAMRTGWLCDGGSWYMFGPSGAMLTGWQNINGSWYFFEPSGVMASSRWVGSCYVMSNGIMATNVWVGNYHVGPNGYWDLTR